MMDKINPPVYHSCLVAINILFFKGTSVLVIIQCVAAIIYIITLSIINVTHILSS